MVNLIEVRSVSLSSRPLRESWRPPREPSRPPREPSRPPHESSRPPRGSSRPQHEQNFGPGYLRKQEAPTFDENAGALAMVPTADRRYSMRNHSHLPRVVAAEN